MKAKQIPSETWEMKVRYKGKSTTITGSSEEEVKKKAEELQRKNQILRQNEWQKDNFERVSCVLDVGTKKRIKRSGNSVNGFIRLAVEEKLKNLGL